MLRQNKWKIIISSVIILLPCLPGLILWDRLPGTLAVHWGSDGGADRFTDKALAVFLPPLLLLAGHWICIASTCLDKKQENQHPKALGIIFWIIPLLSLWTNGLVYASAFSQKQNVVMLTPIMLGEMFLFIGNYLPKIRQNRTLGIKLTWTLQNEENWNRTHRFGGKVWVICGITMIICSVLPQNAFIPITICVILVAVFIPFIYSYWIYKNHKKEGISYKSAGEGKSQIISVGITVAVLAIFAVFAYFLLFTGKIDVTLSDHSFQIEASYWRDLSVDYAQIDKIEYRDDFEAGTRTNGFGSIVLGMGTFQNEEFGSYTLYSYADATEHIVIEAEGKVLVLGLKDHQETKEIYDALIEKCDVP